MRIVTLGVSARRGFSNHETPSLSVLSFSMWRMIPAWTRSNISSATITTTTTTSYEIQGTIPKMGEGVAVGQYAEVERMFTPQEVAEFVALIHDSNAIHRPLNWSETIKKMPYLQAHQDLGLIKLEEEEEEEDDDNGTTTKVLLPGMLVSSIFSSIFGTLVPGSVYMNQTLNFASPVHASETVLGRVEIEKVRKWRKGGVVVQCDTQVIIPSTQLQAVKGTANVWLPSGYKIVDE